MSRTSRKIRLDLFASGNDRCPICLNGFTESAVQKGQGVTLEHVPPKAFNAGGFAMCLTCSKCNNSASRMEMATVESQREQKVQLEIQGIPIHTARISVDERGNISSHLSKLRVPQEVFSRSLRSARTITLTGRVAAPHYTSVSWLKAAYLSVFSLLGKHGYLYAKGEAIKHVRRQIVEPSQEIIRHFSRDAPPEFGDVNGILMNCEQRPCWAVKMGSRLVLLPRGRDTSFYEWVESLAERGGEMRLGGGPLWYPARFGHLWVVSIHFRDGYGLGKSAEGDLFGKTGKVTWGNRAMRVVVADDTARHVTAMGTEGLT